MDIIDHDCPHCDTRGAAFRLHHPGTYVRDSEGSRIYDALATCRLCNRSLMVTLAIKSGAGLKDASWRHSEVVGAYPNLPSSAAPEFTPQNVSRFFEQGMENLARNWDAAGMMFRKALDAGQKNKWPEVTGTLYERIEEISTDGGLTADMKEWAHQIRLDGNDAIHEDEPMEESRARALAEFTRLFLLYAFSLPAMLREARKQDTTDAA